MDARGKPPHHEAVDAGFHATPDSGTASTCAGTKSGSCCFETPAMVPPALPNVSAGAITIDDGTTKTVNAFTPTVVAGGFMAGINPALSQTTALTVPKASDFTNSWTAGTMAGAQAFLAIAALKGSTQEGSVTCQVDDSAGTVTVPHTLFSTLTTGDNLTIALERLTTNKAVEGNVTVTADVFAETQGAGKLQ